MKQWVRAKKHSLNVESWWILGIYIIYTWLKWLLDMILAGRGILGLDETVKHGAVQGRPMGASGSRKIATSFSLIFVTTRNHDPNWSEQSEHFATPSERDFCPVRSRKKLVIFIDFCNNKDQNRGHHIWYLWFSLKIKRGHHNYWWYIPQNPPKSLHPLAPGRSWFGTRLPRGTFSG